MTAIPHAGLHHYPSPSGDAAPSAAIMKVHCCVENVCDIASPLLTAAADAGINHQVMIVTGEGEAVSTPETLEPGCLGRVAVTRKSLCARKAHLKK